MIEPGGIAHIPLGIGIAMPSGVEAQMRSRSGFVKYHHVHLINGVATLDSDYRGEFSAILKNDGPNPFRVIRGMRIVQLVFARVERPEFREVAVLPTSPRGEDGCGSTGDF